MTAARHSRIRNQPSAIDPIVSQLHALRVASLEHRQRLNKPPKLPSRKTLATIANAFAKQLP
ncbi:MAG: serine acetyltransferase, partial [Betaproteobacteria bacterium]|nr:serine acetyltransferase [Betaproteobacteria bacterium]